MSENKNQDHIQESKHSHVIVNENSSANLEANIVAEKFNDSPISTHSHGDKSPCCQNHEPHQQHHHHLDSSVNQEKTSVSPPSQASHEQEEYLSARISKAIAIKNSAESFVNQADYNEAIRAYESAYYALKPTNRDRSHPDWIKCFLLQAELFNGLSHCYGSLERYQESVQYAKRVLLLDAGNIKALYMCALGHKNMGHFVRAYEEIKRAKQIYKIQHPDQPLDTKIQELYASLQTLVNGTSSKNSTQQTGTEPPARSALSYRIVRYSLCAGPIVMLTVIGWRVVKERTVRAVKRQIPAIVAAIGALLILRYIKNNVRGSVWGMGLAVAAAIMIQRYKN